MVKVFNLAAIEINGNKVKNDKIVLQTKLGLLCPLNNLTIRNKHTVKITIKICELIAIVFPQRVILVASAGK